MNEAFVKHRINTQLSNLGWILDGKDRNVFLEGACINSEQKAKLEGKRPDYILYGKNSNTPLAIIEAKKPNGDLNFALRQGLLYAKQLGVHVVFATDSYIVRVAHISSDRVTIDGEILDSFVKEELLKKFSDNPQVETEENIVKSRDDLIKLFKRAEKLLRQDGIDAGMDSIYEFCSILFLKIMSENGRGSNDYYHWDNLIKHRGDNLYEHYKKTIEHFRKQYQGIFREIKIENPRVLESIVDSLKRLNLSNTDIDIKGAAYEYFLKRYSSQNKSVLGQHFTPRHIINMMVVLLDPKIKEKIYDPFCGTGGMLIECYKWIGKNIKAARTQDLKILKEDTLFGNDISFGTSQLAKMNMVLIGDGHANIEKKDSLENIVHRQFDCLLTNIPFNMSSTDAGRKYYETSDTNANSICLRHCIKSLKTGGRACLVVPENICYEDSYFFLRRFLVESGKIEAVIRLPRHTFSAYTSARTCIIWITEVHKEKTKEFFYVEIENDGYSKGAWKEPIFDNDIQKILEYKHTLNEIYPGKTLDKNYLFIKGDDPADKAVKEDFFLLGELLSVKKQKQKLKANKIYKHPRISSKTNSISNCGEGRLGKNIKGEKIIAEPGDLVIGTLHTQSGNGLFAISDDTYVATSQIVATIRTEKISKEFLTLMLQSILPKMSKDDLTGRETYKKKDILSLRIPKQPKNFSPDKYQKLLAKTKHAEQNLKDYENQYKLP